MSLKANLLIAAVLLGAGLIAGILGGVYHAGAAKVEAATEKRDAADALGGAVANAHVAIAAAAAAGQHADTQSHLQQEADDARRVIEHAPPATPRERAGGEVGPTEMVRPDLARLVLCRVERVRHVPLQHCNPDGSDPQRGDPVEPQSALSAAGRAAGG